MRYKKFMIILILLIFTTGMIMGTASASHTFKAGKYKCTISDKQYKKMKTKSKTKYVDKTFKTNMKFHFGSHKYKIYCTVTKYPYAKKARVSFWFAGDDWAYTHWKNGIDTELASKKVKL